MLIPYWDRPTLKIWAHLDLWLRLWILFAVLVPVPVLVLVQCQVWLYRKPQPNWIWLWGGLGLARFGFDGFHIVVKKLRWGTKQPWSGSRKYYPLCPHLNLSNIFNLYFILHYWFSCHFSCPVVQLFCSYVEYYFQLCNIYCRPVKLKKNILSIYFSLYMNLMNTLSEYIHT